MNCVLNTYAWNKRGYLQCWNVMRGLASTSSALWCWLGIRLGSAAASNNCPAVQHVHLLASPSLDFEVPYVLQSSSAHDQWSQVKYRVLIRLHFPISHPNHLLHFVGRKKENKQVSTTLHWSVSSQTPNNGINSKQNCNCSFHSSGMHHHSSLCRRLQEHGCKRPTMYCASCCWQD